MEQAHEGLEPLEFLPYAQLSEEFEEESSEPEGAAAKELSEPEGEAGE